MGKVVASIAIALLSCGLCAAPQQTGSQTSSGDLHSQAAAAVLQQQFADPDVSYLLVDHKGQIVAQRWEEAQREVTVGSLIKPFIAVAYGRSHSSFPVYRCTGGKVCWLPRGHGKLGIRDAIALSCNSYFYQLYAQGAPGFAGPVLRSFGLNATTDGRSGSASPVALAKAYLELAAQRRDKALSSVIEGMALSAKRGTGKAAGAELHGLSVLAKTGTAPCIHSRAVPGDGFAVLITPVDRAEQVLLVRVHGKPGSFAAGVAGKMLAAIENAGEAR